MSPYAGTSKSVVKKSVYEVLEVLRRGKWFILVVFLLVMIGVVVYTSTVPPQYEAYALLLIDTPGGTSGDDAQSLGFIDNAGLDVLSALAGSDSIVGGTADDVLYGDAGRFLRQGSTGGADTMIGGDGNDVFYGDAGVLISNGSAST